MAQASSQPRPVATAIWVTAPGMAIAFTSSRITPISDSSIARSMSATKPGVKGPARMPATR